jgi:hypothetical protein
VHWYPLQGDYSDNANATSMAVVQPASSGCASFTAVEPASSAWTQSCSSTQNPATLLVPWPGESGDVSLCVYAYVSVWGQETNYFFSCDSFTSGEVDCIEVRYDAAYGILIGALNVNGGGNSGVISLSTNQWYHICATYTTATSTLLIYINAAVVTTVPVAHTASTYGSPVLAGDGDYQAYPIQGAFINLRQYSVALTQAQIAALYVSDAP